jgi:predicted GNAT superfamily acetyltransferase
MSISENCRGAGMSRKSFTELKEFCKKKGFKRVVLSTSELQSAACIMYPKLGFKEVKTEGLLGGFVTVHFFALDLK